MVGLGKPLKPECFQVLHLSEATHELHFSLVWEVLNQVGADRVAVKFSIFPANGSCLLLS